MNKVILMGRLTRDPEVRYSQGEQATAIARYTLAVDRRFKRDGDQTVRKYIQQMLLLKNVNLQRVRMQPVTIPGSHLQTDHHQAVQQAMAS